MKDYTKSKEVVKKGIGGGRRKVMGKILGYYLLSRVMFLGFAILAVRWLVLRDGYIGSQFDAKVPYWVWIWANFDGRHYLDIATQGYRRFNFAFNPLYPMLMSVVGSFWRVSHIYIGMGLSLFFLLLSLPFVYRVAKLDLGEKLAGLSVVLLLFYPLAFFYQSVYSDALFLFLSTVCFYLARKGKWFWCGVFGFLSVLARLAGVALVPALAVEWYLQNRGKVKQLGQGMILFLRSGLVALFLTGLGQIAFMIYLQKVFGDAWLFVKATVAWHQDKWVFPLQTGFRYLKMFWLVDWHILEYWRAVLEFGSLFLYLGMAVFVWRRIRASYGVFMMVLLMLVPLRGTFEGTPRYALHLFPMFMGLALLVGRNKLLRIVVLGVFLILGLVLTALFTRGYFMT